MKLIDGIQQLKGKPARILDCSRKEFPEFLVEMGYKVGVEVGVYKGEFTERLCKAGLKMFAVDPWMAFEGQGRDSKRQERQDFLFAHAKRVLASYDCTFIRKTSMDALSNFKDRSLDFVYIDGDHSFRHIAADIVEWEKKVRTGGIVSGHDYFNSWPKSRNSVCQVGVIVDAYTKVFEIENWWVFGELDPIKEPNAKERFLSWMWVKG